MKVIDLFCGAGGFSEGFRNAGFNLIWAIDIWPVAIDTYKANHPKACVVLDDVVRLSLLPDEEFNKLIPDSEIIIGSPPCVAFSNSNKSGKADKTNGLKLVLAFLRIVARKKYKAGSILKYWIMENVPNIASFIDDSYSAEQLGCLGTFVLQVKGNNSGVYQAENFGVPSRRKRFLCGEFPSPVKSNNQKCMPLRSILDALKPPKKDLNSVIADPNYPSLSIESRKLTDHHYIQEIAKYQWETAIRLKQDKGYMGRMSFPENLDKPARTVMATMTFGARESMIFALEGSNDKRYRAPTIREVSCLMSFPIDYLFYGASKGIKYQQVGNAVPPKMAYAIAKAIVQQESIRSTKTFIKTIRDQNGHFNNLNFKQYPLPVEKPKLPNSRFKYHIPYLIIDSFRVELTNNKSNFKESGFIWGVEIHRSQGKKAKVFTPEIKDSPFFPKEQDVIEEFINNLPCLAFDFNAFQKIYCMTSKQRMEASLMGPYELLRSVRKFIDDMALIRNNDNNEQILIPEEPYVLPKTIMIGYYILRNVMDQMGD